MILNGSRQPDGAFIDSSSGLIIDIPTDMSGPITVEVRTPTGNDGGDPGGVIIII